MLKIFKILAVLLFEKDSQGFDLKSLNDCRFILAFLEGIVLKL